ncbi:phosphoenolpyruvate carboxykinase (ATP) [Acidicapsa acidisoli]|uniref:aldolase n=1 Tax=Acidicapsa acidisoli TaxID=1615681 RepID=UPI0021DFF8E6|nr:aldolase [Acidicapsa acidisoli]
MFEKQHTTDLIRADVQVVTSDANVCPPAPAYRLILPLMIGSADADNYSIVDLERSHASIVISQAALRNPLYAQYFLLGVPACCITTRYTTPIHAGCVGLHGRGVLLCGDSGAGKSTLSYACARAGWTYTSDDACFLLDQGFGRRVTGNCHQVRFRPTAVELFPELSGLEITPRAAGKPSIELSTQPMRHIRRASTMGIDAIVFLNRNWDRAPQLVPGSLEAARKSMREVLFGSVDTRAVQHKAIDRLLTAPLYELRYTKLDDAISLLRGLVGDGR